MKFKILLIVMVNNHCLKKNFINNHQFELLVNHYKDHHDSHPVSYGLHHFIFGGFKSRELHLLKKLENYSRKKNLLKVEVHEFMEYDCDICRTLDTETQAQYQYQFYPFFFPIPFF